MHLFPCLRERQIPFPPRDLGVFVALTSRPLCSPSNSERTELLSASLCEAAHLQQSCQVVACVQAPITERTLLTLSQCARMHTCVCCRHGAGLCVAVAVAPGRRCAGVLGSAGKARRTYVA